MVASEPKCTWQLPSWRPGRKSFIMPIQAVYHFIICVRSIPGGRGDHDTVRFFIGDAHMAKEVLGEDSLIIIQIACVWVLQTVFGN